MDQRGISNQLRGEARKFQEAAKKLIAAADILDGLKETSSVGEQPSNGTASAGGRKEQLHKLIRERGPLHRKEIRSLLPDVPKGTLGFLLSARGGLKRNDHGKWEIISK